MQTKQVMIFFAILIGATYLAACSIALVASAIVKGEESVKEPVENTERTHMVAVYISDAGKTVNISLEDYVIGVVAAEMPASYHIEALKAQAVAARTYALKYLLSNSSICDTEYCQVYIDETDMRIKWGEDYALYHSKIRQAVRETKNEVLFYEDELIEALYFASSAGYTVNSEDSEYNYDAKEYLRGVDVPWDVGNVLDGHGVGMSQKASGKMAEENYKYVEILKYFYTGVELAIYE